MGSRLRVGVIGTGFGSLVQIPAFRAHPRVEVVAVASGTPGKAGQTARAMGIPRAFDDWTELVAADLDLVSITTPPVLHHAMATAALDAGRHVLCEKPMAMSAAEAEEMLARGERARRLHVVDHELRFNPNRRKVKRLIEQGFIGAPRHVLLTVVNVSRLDPAKPWGWWFDAARGGGLLGAVGSHQVDLLRYWLGDVAAVTGTAVPVVPERPLPDGSGRRAVTADEFSTFSAPVPVRGWSAPCSSAQSPRIPWARVPRSGATGGALVLDEAERLWAPAAASPWRSSPSRKHYRPRRAWSTCRSGACRSSGWSSISSRPRSMARPSRPARRSGTASPSSACSTAVRRTTRERLGSGVRKRSCVSDHHIVIAAWPQSGFACTPRHPPVEQDTAARSLSTNYFVAPASSSPEKATPAPASSPRRARP